MKWTLLCLWVLLASPAALRAQSAAEAQDEAVGESINYVFATDLGSGVYELDQRTLQIYRFRWDREWRTPTATRPGLRFVVPVTVGFFDFEPLDVVNRGLPGRVDSFSVVPGLELDYLLPQDWHLVPYARAGFSVASSSVDGLLYGAGVRLERRAQQRGWDSYFRTELAWAGVHYRHDTPGDQFLRLRQGFDFTRATGRRWRQHQLEVGLYGLFDLVGDPPTAPVAGAGEQRGQAEFGVTLGTRPRLKLWRFDAPRVGLGYRLAGDLSGWRLILGQPF